MQVILTSVTHCYSDIYYDMLAVLKNEPTCVMTGFLSCVLTSCCDMCSFQQGGVSQQDNISSVALVLQALHKEHVCV